jgi:hypothetical protein
MSEIAPLLVICLTASTQPATRGKTQHQLFKHKECFSVDVFDIHLPVGITSSSTPSKSKNLFVYLCQFLFRFPTFHSQPHLNLGIRYIEKVGNPTHSFPPGMVNVGLLPVGCRSVCPSMRSDVLSVRVGRRQNGDRCRPHLV